jgi:signal transduction histidine kinase
MGALTASIAHEINQPLTAITMGSRAGLRWLSKEPPNLSEVRAVLENIARDGERAGQVIDSLRAMFKSGQPRKAPSRSQGYH